MISEQARQCVISEQARQCVISEQARQCVISEQVIVLFGLLYFTSVWKYTLGGYLCALLLFPLVLTCSYFSGDDRTLLKFVKNSLSSVKENLIFMFQMQKKRVFLFVAYAGTKVMLVSFYPKLESSNGSPVSLILFTIYFITIFSISSVMRAMWSAVTHIIQSKTSTCRVNRAYKLISNSTVYEVILKWRKAVLLTFIAVVLSYVLDGDLTCILRYAGHGDSCWPLLIPPSMQHSLPYPLQYAWFQEWHKMFSTYRPPGFIRELAFLGREMEVSHILPVLIGTYLLSEILLLKHSRIIKQVLFGCIAGVVLSGVISGALKILFHRYRPNAYGNPYMWTGPSMTTVNYLSFSKLDLSFPCGHTTVSASIATCIYTGLLYSAHISQGQQPSVKFKVFLALCLFFYPTIVLFSRVSECIHWTSDAIFGVSLYYRI